jgi:hypothetical protein
LDFKLKTKNLYSGVLDDIGVVKLINIGNANDEATGVIERIKKKLATR